MRSKPSLAAAVVVPPLAPQKSRRALLALVLMGTFALGSAVLVTSRRENFTGTMTPRADELPRTTTSPITVATSVVSLPIITTISINTLPPKAAPRTPSPTLMLTNTMLTQSPHPATATPHAATIAWSPNWTLADDGGAAEQQAQTKSDELLRRALNEPDLSVAQREGLQREAVVARSIGNEIRYVIDGVPDTPPPPARVAATVSRSSQLKITYAVLTGRASYRDRIHGLHALLSGRKVVWFSDEGHPIIRPVVPTSAFEADVCARNLAHDTQFKGCRYQRHFYWVLDIMQLSAAACGNFTALNPIRHLTSNASLNETDWDGLVASMHDARWWVRLSDDTLVVAEHLEAYIASLVDKYDPLTTAVVAGKMERRNGYWFYSGGHPMVFSRAALLRWGTPKTGEGYRCEGTVIDTAPLKLKKFWWWADDVLVSHCIAVANNPPYVTLDLQGAISVERFRMAPIPQSLFATVTYLASDASAVAPSSTVASSSDESLITQPAKKKKKKKAAPGLETRRFNVTALPVSYHSYPYISPRQMYNLWNHLHPS